VVVGGGDDGGSQLVPGMRGARRRSWAPPGQGAGPADGQPRVLHERAGWEADAVAAYQAAIDSGHHDAARQAMVNLGVMRRRAGRGADAVAAYQAAIDSDHPDQAPQAMVSVGVLLDRSEEAHEHWDRALGRATIWVLVSIAPVLAVEGDLERARGLLAEAEA